MSAPRAAPPEPEAAAARAAALGECIGALQAVRAESPRVHCITNAVVLEITANALLAVGAIPAMSTDAEEVGDFVGGSRALLVNLGTLDDQRRRAIHVALDRARGARVSWVLDPVMVDLAPRRLAYARELLDRAPAVVRGNGREIDVLLAGVCRGRGPVVCRTGPQDEIRDGENAWSVTNGDPLMNRVTGVGCVCSALAAALLGAGATPSTAALGAAVGIGVAGEVAAERSAGPGTFRSALIDALYGLDADTLEQRARLHASRATRDPARPGTTIEESR